MARRRRSMVDPSALPIYALAVDLAARGKLVDVWPGPLGFACRPPHPCAGKRIEHPVQNGLHVRKDAGHYGTVLSESHHHVPMRP